MSRGVPLSALVSDLLSRGVGISDVHLQAGERVRVRKQGLVEEIEGGMVTNEDILELLAAGGRAAESLWTGSLLPEKDLDFILQLREFRFRCSLFRVRGQNLALVMRVIQKDVPSLVHLGLPEQLQEIAHRANGLFLVTGSTGSGKSTTLASLINTINESQTGRIITLEDPVEFLITSKKCLVSQREVGEDVSDFLSGLKFALRQDPDVLFVGEMRDRATVEVALSAAETGHLVLSTLHTAGARQAVERIASFFPNEREWANQVLSSVLIGVLSQCLMEGTKGGRVLGTELMLNTSSIRQAIREGQTHFIFNHMETGRHEGQQLLNDDLLRLVLQGAISAETALYYTYDPVGLSKLISQGGRNGR